MSNRFRNIDDHVYRVVGELPDGTLEVLQGPYTNKGTAKGLATRMNRGQDRTMRQYNVPEEYVRIFAQETVPNWVDI